MKKPFFSAVFLAASTVAGWSAEYTWNGAGGDNFWTTGANWGGTAPGAAQTLIFDGTTRLTPDNNNTAGWGVFGIRFGSNAGAFTLSGNSINLSTGVTNNSGNLQTLDLAITMASHLNFNTAAGDILSTQGITGSHRLDKYGLGTLTLRGTNSWSGGVYHQGGKIVYDYTGGGSFPTTGSFFFGVVGSPTLGNTATLEVKGAATSSLPALYLGSYTHAANQIIVGSSMAATAASINLTGNATTNFNLSASGASLDVSSSPSLDHGLLLRGTVTDSTKTGFATVASGVVQRFTAFDGTLVAGYNPNNNYTFSGTASMGAANINTLTLTGGGSLTIAGSSGLWTRALLMESGVSDFTFDAVVRQSGQLFVHQYSTAGTLVLNNRIHDVDSAYGLSKTGPGTVQIASTSSSSYTGATYVQQGLLQLDGALTKTATVTVFDGASLSGGGTMGSASSSTVTIRAGGALIGTSSAALDITGTLGLNDQSKFSFTLGTGSDSLQVSGAVTLGSDVTLQLALSGTPAFNTPLYLLQSDTSITGNFVYNGAVIADEDTFSLGGYDFTYFQDSQNIWVEAVPEPSTALLGGLGTLLFLVRRRRDGRQDS